RLPRSTPFPYTTLFRSSPWQPDRKPRPIAGCWRCALRRSCQIPSQEVGGCHVEEGADVVVGDSVVDGSALTPGAHQTGEAQLSKDRKSTRLNSSHVKIS